MAEGTELPLSVDDREGFGGEDPLDPEGDDCGGGIDGNGRAALPRIVRLWSCAACSVAASTFSISSWPKMVAKSRAVRPLGSRVKTSLSLVIAQL